MPRPSAALKLTGLDALTNLTTNAVAEATRESEYWVGSSVEYGVYHEFGTEVMPARPHWRPAIMDLETDAAVHKAAIGKMFDRRARVGMLATLAFALERKVKQQITQQHIIDTSNYRGSVAAAPTEAEVKALSDARRIK